MFSCDKYACYSPRQVTENAVVFDITVGNFYSVSVEPTDH